MYLGDIMISLSYKKTLYIQIVLTLLFMSLCSYLFYLHGTRQTQKLIYSNIQDHMHDITYTVKNGILSEDRDAVEQYIAYKAEDLRGISSINILRGGEILFSSSDDTSLTLPKIPHNVTTGIKTMLKDHIYAENFTVNGQIYTLAAQIAPDVSSHIRYTIGRDVFIYTFAILLIITAVQLSVYYMLYYLSFIRFYENIKGSRLSESYTITELTSLSRLINGLLSKLNRTAEETEKQKDLFRTMFYNMPIAAYYKDKEGKYLGGNQKFCRLIGLNEKDLIGKTVYDVLSREKAIELEQKDRELYDNPENMQIYEEKILVTSLDSRHDIIYYKSALKDKQGNPQGILAVMMDITDIRTLEKEIINEKDRLEQMFRRHSAAMILVDPATGRIIDANDSALSFMGFSPDELIGRTADEIGFMNRYDFESNLRHSIAFKNFHSEIVCHPKNSEEKTVEIFSTPIKTADSSLIFVISHDITQKKRQEKLNLLQTVIADAFLLEKEEVIFRHLSMSIAGAFRCKAAIVTYTDADGGEINPLGISLDEETVITTSIVDSDDVIGHMSLYGKTDGFTFDEREDALYIANLISPMLKHWYRNKYHEQNLQNEKKALEQIVQQEMDNKKRQEQVIFEQKKFADMGLMINAVAHHWRQPLNAMGIMVQTLRDLHDDNELTTDEIDYFEQNAMRLIKYLSDTIDNFRYFFSTDKEKIRFNAPDELFNLLSLFNIQLAAKKISVTTACTCDGESIDCTHLKNFNGCGYEGAEVLGYLSEFKQSMINVLYNAVDAVQAAVEQGRIEKGMIDIKINVSESGLVITVEDNGGGIPPENMFMIFDPYFSTKGEGKGTGLGLYMTRLMLENHMEGRITAENTEKGAKFTMILPVCRS